MGPISTIIWHVFIKKNTFLSNIFYYGHLDNKIFHFGHFK